MTHDELNEALLVERFGPKPKPHWRGEATDRFEAAARVAALEAAVKDIDEEDE